MKWNRTLTAVFLCFLLILGEAAPLAVGFAEPEASAAAQVSEAPAAQTQAPTQAPTPVVTESAPTPTPVVTEIPATQAPEQTHTAQPTAPVLPEETAKVITALAFEKERVTVTMAQYHAGLDYGALNTLRAYPQGATGELLWSVRDRRDGDIDDTIACFAAYDKDGERLTGNYAEEDVKEIRFEVYKTGTVYIRAALKADARVYAEFAFVIAPDEEEESAQPSAEPSPLPEGSATPAQTEKPASDDDGSLIAEDLLDPEPWPQPDPENVVEGGATPVPSADASGTENPDDGAVTPAPTEDLLDPEPWPQPDPENVVEGDATPVPSAEAEALPDASAPMLGRGAPAGNEVSLISIESALALYVGDAPYTITPAVDPSCESCDISWADDASGHATVDENGVVTPVSPGETVVTVTLTVDPDTTYTASCVVTVRAVPTEKIVFAQTEKKLAPQQTFQVPYTVDTRLESYALSWSSSNPSVADVDPQTGLITADAAGSAIITASFTNYHNQQETADFNVTVGDYPTALELDAGVESAYLLGVDDSVPLSVSVPGMSPDQYQLSWAITGDSGVISLENGLVTTLAPGRAAVIISTENGLEVRVDFTVATISLSAGDQTTVARGSSLQLQAEVLPSDLEVVWESSDPLIATVADGLVYGVEKGEAVIYATIEGSEDITDSLPLNVVVPATEISISGAAFDQAGNFTLNSSDAPLTLTATLLPADTTDEFSWNLPQVPGITAQISEDGLSVTLSAEQVDGDMVAPGGTALSFTATAGALSAPARTVIFAQTALRLEITSDSIETTTDPETGDVLRRYIRLYTTGENTAGTLGFSVFPADAVVPEVVWSSDSPGVTVENGVVTAVSQVIGAKISVSAGDLSDAIYADVHVRAQYITLDKTYETIDRYSDDITYQIHASVYPTEADEIFWTSMNTDVATVERTGDTVTVTAHKAGYAVIVARTSDTDPLAPHAISLLKVTQRATGIDLHIDPFPGMADKGLVVAIGQIVGIGITIEPADVSTGGYTLISNNTSYLAVSGNLIKGVRTGYTTVTVVSNDRDDNGNPIVSRTINIRVVPKKKGVTSFKLNASKGTLYQGGSYTLKGYSSPSGAYDKKVFWYSGDESIATVNSSGKITAVAPGVVKIYGISSSGIIRYCTVTVKPLKATSVSISQKTLYMYVGDKYTLAATANPAANITYDVDKVISWYSSKTTSTLVNDEGVVYAVSAGTSYVYARATSGKYAKCKVVVKNRPVTMITLRPYNYEDTSANILYKGGSYFFDTEVTYDFEYFGEREYSVEILKANTANSSVVWASNSKYLKVNYTTGEVVPTRTGTYYLYFKAPGLSNYFAAKFVVKDAPVLSLSIEDSQQQAVSTLDLLYDDEQNASAQLSANVELDGTSTGLTPESVAVTWKSSNSRVASVNASGLVTATGLGTATITATPAGLSGKSKTVTVNVTRTDGTDDVTYRALVIGMFQNPKASGYLPFSVNSTRIVRNALYSSSINGKRYQVTYYNNNTITNGTRLKNAITSTFSGAKAGDVSVIYLLSHGGVASNTEYRWAYDNKKVESGTNIVNWTKGINGDVVVLLCSCHSGNTQGSRAVIGLASAADETKSNGSYSMICSTDGATNSGYSNTSSYLSIDFFSAGFGSAFSGSLTVPQLAANLKAQTTAQVELYKATYGKSSVAGNLDQQVQSYISPDAANVQVCG